MPRAVQLSMPRILYVLQVCTGDRNAPDERSVDGYSDSGSASSLSVSLLMALTAEVISLASSCMSHWLSHNVSISAGELHVRLNMEHQRAVR